MVDVEEYIAMLEEWLPPITIRAMSYDPKLVYFQAGVDALAVDSFGKLKMTRAGMLRVRTVFAVPAADCASTVFRWAAGTRGRSTRAWTRTRTCTAFRVLAVRDACARSRRPPVQAATEKREAGRLDAAPRKSPKRRYEKVVADVNADEAKFTRKTKPASKAANDKSDKFTTQIAAQIARSSRRRPAGDDEQTGRGEGQAGGGSIRGSSPAKRRLVRRSARGGPDTRWRAP